MDLTKVKKICSKCGAEKTLDKLFRCSDCREVFCNEHSSDPGIALCLDCYNIWYESQTEEYKTFLKELGVGKWKVFRMAKEEFKNIIGK